MDRLLGNHRLRVLSEDAAGVGVAIEPREVAARNFESDSVPGEKHVPGGAEIERELDRLTRREKLHSIEAVSIARPEDSFGQRSHRAVGRDVEKLSGEVGIAGRRGGVKDELDVTGRLERLFERR
jgi:hypothetical protein